MAELTRWFNWPSERPVRKGYYETRRHGTNGSYVVIWLWWSGSAWLSSKKSVRTFYQFTGAREWRGLTEPAR